MKIFLIVLFILLAVLHFAYGSGGAEKESVDRGEYQVSKGNIIPPEEVYEDNYVSAVDYQYPDPKTSFGVRFNTGNRLVSLQGGETVILIGIQGRRFTYDDLPVMNQSFVMVRARQALAMAAETSTPAYRRCRVCLLNPIIG